MKKGDLGILVVDDELIVRESLTKWFREDGFRVDAAADGAGALKKVQQESWNLVLVDIRMPGMDGMELLHRIKKLKKNTVVIIITAFATVETAVRALKEGAYDYITKPIDPDYLSHLVINALEQQLLNVENQRLREAVTELTAGSEIVGECPEMRRVTELIQTVAVTEAPVLISGEVGTGKELVARAIHHASARKYAPLVTVNCGSLSDSMQADELFGHEPDSYPGAVHQRKGKLESAVGGTLFLDEVNALDRSVQNDLVKILERGHVTRLGGSDPVPTSFRMICATTVDLAVAAHDQKFLQELYYRIAVFTLSLPPLRARRGDIAKLAHFFLLRYGRSMNRRVDGFTPERDARPESLRLARQCPGTAKCDRAGPRPLAREHDRTRASSPSTGDSKNLGRKAAPGHRTPAHRANPPRNRLERQPQRHNPRYRPSDTVSQDRAIRSETPGLNPFPYSFFRMRLFDFQGLFAYFLQLSHDFVLREGTMAQTQYDVVIVGGGPGGYTAAVRAAQLGLKTALIERDRLGGICLNWGCIPTKALLRNAELVHQLRHADQWGITFDAFHVDFAQVVKRSRGIAERMSKGVEYLMKKNAVTVIHGHARLLAADVVEVRAEGKGTSAIKARHIVLATGARPRQLPGVTIDRKRIVTSTEGMALPELPGSLLVIGGGAIGMEFASFYQALGTKVTVVEMMPSILPIEDRELTKLLASSLAKRGIEILTETRVENAVVGDNGVAVRIVAPSEERELNADIALVAIGVQGNVENLGLESLGIKVERGHIVVDKAYQTAVPGVHAIGDVIGPPWLAHVASAEAVICVETIAGKNPGPLDYSTIPGCTYCQPQLASVGFTEEMAKAEGYEVMIGRFPYKALGKAVAIGETEGMVKLVFDAKYGELLGGHILGTDATELIAELVLAKKMEATAPDLYRTIHAHPTLSEGIMEAAAAAYGEAINI